MAFFMEHVEDNPEKHWTVSMDEGDTAEAIIEALQRVPPEAVFDDIESSDGLMVFR